MFLDDIGMVTDSLPLMWFVDTSPFSRYGSWGGREFTDQAATPKVKGVQKFLDKALGVHPLSECVVIANNSRWGNGLSDLSSSFVGPPQVLSPLAGDVLVQGQQYGILWDAGPLALRLLRSAEPAPSLLSLLRLPCLLAVATRIGMTDQGPAEA